jgi:hypothetical protein
MGRRKVSSRTEQIGGKVRPEIAEKFRKHAELMRMNQSEMLDHALTVYLGSEDLKRERLARRLGDLETKVSTLAFELDGVKPKGGAQG